MYIHATGTGHGLVAPLALCLGPPGKNVSKMWANMIYGIHPIKKVLEKIFSGVEKICHAGGQATPRVPHLRAQGQLAAMYTMV